MNTSSVGWVVIGIAALVSLFLPWPAMLIVGCTALSRFRGPDHYTKFMVPYAYRFKWDPGWIFIAVIAVLGAIGAMVGDGLPWLLLLASVVAMLRVVVWLCFRFPLMSWFFVMLLMFLFGIGWRARFFF